MHFDRVASYSTLSYVSVRRLTVSAPILKVILVAVTLNLGRKEMNFKLKFGLHQISS